MIKQKRCDISLIQAVTELKSLKPTTEYFYSEGKVVPTVNYSPYNERTWRSVDTVACIFNFSTSGQHHTPGLSVCFNPEPV